MSTESKPEVCPGCQVSVASIEDVPVQLMIGNIHGPGNAIAISETLRCSFGMEHRINNQEAAWHVVGPRHHFSAPSGATTKVGAILGYLAQRLGES